MICKKYVDSSLSNLNPSEIAEQVGKYGVVAIIGSKASPEEFADWSYEMGYHLSPDVWCTDKEHSNGLFWRVTNKIVDGTNRGLKSDHELDWHCNINPVLDAEEVVGLYGKTISFDTQTWFCNSLPFWNTLDEDLKDRLRTLKVRLDPKRQYGRIQESGWTPNWKNYPKKIMDDIYKNRQTRNIADATNMEPENSNLYNKSRGIIEDINFVPDHPVIGKNGFSFSPYEIHAFLEEDGSVCKDSEDLYWWFWEDWVQSETYTYKHDWNEGDIVLMDQTTTIHRRPRINMEQPRELLRAAMWYKTKNRNHYNYIF